MVVPNTTRLATLPRTLLRIEHHEPPMVVPNTTRLATLPRTLLRIEYHEPPMVVQEELEQRHHLEARPGFGEQPLDVRGLVGLEQPLGAVDKDRGGEDGQQLEVIESDDAIPQQ